MNRTSFTDLLDKLYIPALLIFAFITSLNFYKEKPKNVLWSDAEGYYLYLPAVFIYDGFERVPPQSGQMTKLEGTDKIYTKYTCGVAVLEAPFFLIGQAVSALAGKDTSGFSSWSNFAIRMAALFYAIAGLVILRKILVGHFGKVLTMVTVASIFLGTNLFYYTVEEAGMSHAYSFFLFALFILYTPRFLSGPSFGKACLLGLVFGLITLVRPTNCILALYLLLYNVYNFSQLKERLLFLIKQLKFLWVVPVLMFLVFIPQFYYWYYMSGNFVIYSYNQEGFIYWMRPKILLVLFDVQNGWLLYSPVMLFALIGLGIAVFQRKYSGPAILLIIFLATYIFASWWAWWFGGAFGHRCFIEFHCLLAIPFAYFLQALQSGSARRLRPLIYPLIAFLLFYNIRLTHLYSPPWDGQDWTWERFGQVLKQL